MRKPRVLMLIRPNALTHRGGDTVVLEKYSEHLRAIGTDVTIDLEGKRDPQEFDLVHIINFATPEITERFARRCVARKVRYVATTLYEDWPRFFSQMIVAQMLYDGYVKNGQPSELWGQFEHVPTKVPDSAKLDNTFAAAGAQLLIVSGEEERRVLEKDYAVHGQIEVCHFGCEIPVPSDGGRAFREMTGLDEYILCVGRLEMRKNQLALLKALEDWDVPIVFATGGFSYEPQYAALCQNFQRKGKNLFLGRLPAEILASAYEGALCHALPSWYELPGLVTLEAAARGTPVVAADWGTIRDYCGEQAQYCSPIETRSIEHAMIECLSRPKNNSLQQHVKQFTWERAAKRMLELYELALSQPLRSIPSDIAIQRTQMTSADTAVDLTQPPPELLVSQVNTLRR